MPQENFLELEERVKLSQIVAELYDFTDGGVRGRRTLMESAGLRRFVSGIDLSDAPRTVAIDLISRLEVFGILPERENYHALGALLSYLLTLGDQDLPPDKASFAAELIIKHALVADPHYLHELRTQYDIRESGEREPSPEKSFVPLQIPPQPDFKVAIKDKEFEGLERVIDDESNFLDIYSLLGAIHNAQAVCRIEVPMGAVKGTGFLVGPDVLLTNQHVLRDKNEVKDAVARFDYMLDASGVSSAGRVFKFQTDFYFSSPSEELDYALARLEDQPLKDKVAADAELQQLSMWEMIRRGKHRGYLILAPRFLEARNRVNIIQHPDGNPLKVVMTHNYVVENMNDLRVQYVADTMPGSSGSPVFNKSWEVVALHHSGKPYPPESVSTTFKKISKGKFRVNEGIPARAILKDFEKRGLDRYLPRK